MARIKVLITDDAVVIRKILTEVLSADPDIEVVGTAANGKIALQKIAQLKPDIVTLDVEMPELNGLDTIPLIRKDFPKLPIIMFSTLTDHGGKATLEALARGASDYVTKPANVGNVTNSKERVKEELLFKIKSLAGKKISYSASKLPTSLPKTSEHFVKPKTLSSPTTILVIGVSTGGPNALAELIPALPKEFPVPVMVVQHMPPMFTKLLADRLDAQSHLKVVEAIESMRIEAGTVYLAPGDFHMELKKEGSQYTTHLQQQAKENSCRPAVDVLFRSVAAAYGSGVLSVVLTGMGQDGLVGCKLIKEAGGSVIVQDEASSVVWGMPGYVAEAGLADTILPLGKIAQEIVKRIQPIRMASSQTERRI